MPATLPKAATLMPNPAHILHFYTDLYSSIDLVRFVSESARLGRVSKYPKYKGAVLYWGPKGGP